MGRRDDPLCRGGGSGWKLGTSHWPALLMQLDSLLGATLQQTVVLPNGKIQTDHSAQDTAEGKRVGIGRNVLSNSGVNAVCGFAMAAVGYWYGSRM